MVDTYTQCSGYEYEVTGIIAEHQMKRSIADNLRIQHEDAAQHSGYLVDGEHDWMSAMDGFASKNYFKCTKCGAREEYARMT